VIAPRDRNFCAGNGGGGASSRAVEGGVEPPHSMIIKNEVETTDSTDAHGYSIEYKLVMIHPAGEGVSINISS
jgi:hypothetical protein